jgi:hypothetical protein
MGPTQADRADLPASDREGQREEHAIDQAPGPISLLAVIEPIILENGQHLEADGIRE